MHPTCGDMHRRREGVPVLTYFDVKGLAEPIRILFNLGNVNFVDRRVKDHAEFEAKYKAYSPTGLLPILEVDGQILCESQSIVLYAAKRAGFYPEHPRDQDRSMSILSMLVELYSRSATIPPSVPREERYPKMQAMWRENLPIIFSRIESTITPSGNGWLVGDRLSFIDVVLYYTVALYSQLNQEGAAAVKEQFPKIGASHNAVLEHPGMVAYLKKTDQTKPKLYHGDLTATPIRWMFAIGGVEYEDIRVEEADWPAMEPTIPGGRLPALQLGDGTWLTELGAIAVAVARMAGLTPFRDNDFAHAYSVLLTLAGLIAIRQSVVHAATPEEAEEAKRTAREVTVPTLCRRLEAIVSLRQSPQGYVVGDRLSFADCCVAYMGLVCIEGSLDWFPNLLKEMPCCNKVTNLVFSHPAITEHRPRELVCKPKLSYFDLPGRAEHIRKMLEYANVEFEDHRVGFKTWFTEMKEHSLTGVMPYLDIGDLRIYEIAGCLQYVAELTNMVPRCWKARAHALAIFSVHSNVQKVVLKHYAAPAGEERKAKAVELRPEYFAQLDIWEKIVALQQSAEGYCVGNELSYIDFYVTYELSYNGDCGFLPEDWQEKYPALAKTYNVVKGLEKK